MRWLLVILLACLIFNRAGAWLQKIGLGRLPGDIRFRIAGREFFLPLASAVVLSLLATAITLLI